MCFVNTVCEPKITHTTDSLLQMSVQEVVALMSPEYEHVKQMKCKQCATPLFYIQFVNKYMDFLQKSSHHTQYYTFLKAKANQFIHDIYDQNLTPDTCQCGFAHYHVHSTNQSGHKFILSQLRKIHCKYNPIDTNT